MPNATNRRSWRVPRITVAQLSSLGATGIVARPAMRFRGGLRATCGEVLFLQWRNTGSYGRLPPAMHGPFTKL